MIDLHQKQPVRTGAIAVFDNFDSLTASFDRIVNLLPGFDPLEFRQRYGSNSQPPNVLNYALRIFDSKDDMSEDAWYQQIIELVNSRKVILTEHGVRRLSVLICRPGQYPLYFTLRDVDGSWSEEQAIRHIEPALAFQLELSRLSHYNLTPCFTESKQLHIYHAVARENQLDSRFFIRALVRPSRIRGYINTAQYLISETEDISYIVQNSPLARPMQVNMAQVPSTAFSTTSCSYCAFASSTRRGAGFFFWRLSKFLLFIKSRSVDLLAWA